MLTFLLKGLIIGLAIAAPVGPIGILCIQRSLHDGFKIGLMTGLGAALADGVYGFIAGFGLTAVSSFLVAHQFWIKLIGGLYLIYLGVKILITPPVQKQANDVKKPEKSGWHACGTTFLLTLTNPATILSFVAVFAGLGLGSTHTTYTHAIFLVLGILLGSAIWWFILSGGISLIHHKISSTVMRFINIISGVIILGFGAFALYTLF